MVAGVILDLNLFSDTPASVLHHPQANGSNLSLDALSRNCFRSPRFQTKVFLLMAGILAPLATGLSSCFV